MRLCIIGLVLLTTSALSAQEKTTEWPQWGGSPGRNNTPIVDSLPTEWEVGDFDFRTGQWKPDTASGIRWAAKLGSESYGSPVIAGGRIFFATNNGAEYLERYPKSVDLGCLIAFDQQTGGFLWQYSVEKLEAGADIDWPDQGICCSPLVEGNRLWIVNNRGEVACLDTEGFTDGENAGPCTSEAVEADNEADIVWTFDMMAELGTLQHNMACCSVTSAGDLLFVGTSNGVDGGEEDIPAPNAPSFIALDKNSGELVWADASPGENILHGQWSSPAYGVFDGVPQAIFPGGDGWLYSFLAERTDDGEAKLLWKFDCNPKESFWGGGGYGERNNIIATPVVHDGLVYIATGQDPEAGEDQGDLWCIDPTKRGDVSSELAFDSDGHALPPRRFLAADPEAGDTVRPNPNSAAVWNYRGFDANGDEEYDFEETMHRALGMVAIRDGLLVIGDFAGLVHCLDPKTGDLYWTYDTLATMWGSPLIADGKIYIGDEDGDLAVFELAKEMNLLAEHNLGNSIYGSPVAVDNVLYVGTRSHLIAIEGEK